MATRGATDESEARPLPAFLPVEPGRALSYDLGTRLTADSTAIATFEHASSPGTAALYPATDHTVILAVRTPVGRRLHYETDARVEGGFERAADWERT